MRSIISAAALMFSTPAAAQDRSIIAECGASSGHAFFAAPSTQGWADDRISGGRLRFTLDDAGNPNIIFIDARGGTVDAAADGGTLILTRIDAEEGEFGMLLVYRATGVVETYNVLNMPGGGKRVLWTSNKPRIGQVGLSKVGAYTADCR
jgi:hypothetical protein